MAQSTPTNIDLSSLWSDGTGQTPNGAEFTQIPRGTDRYNEYLEYVTRGCNRNAQMSAQYGRIRLTGDLPQGYTLWDQDNGGKKTVLWLYGHPRGNFRSALNFSDHIPEMLAANDARERRIRAEVKATNDEKAREDIKQNNKEAPISSSTTRTSNFMSLLTPSSPSSKPTMQFLQTVRPTLSSTSPALASSVEGLMQHDSS